MSYGADLIDQYRLTAGYVDRILKGEKPADMPVQAATKYQLAINLNTAKALGLTVLVELSVFRGWQEWINVALGAWLIASTWVLGIVTSAARTTFMLVGVLVVALALYEMWQIRQNPEKQT